MMSQFEALLYQITSIFLVPALVLILVALAYALIATGQLLADGVMFRHSPVRSGLTHFARGQGITSDDLELWIMRRLEKLRLTSRVSPLLGLVATLIPMGPALLALAENEVASVGSNMVVAFAGVTLALIAASLSFVVLNIRRRWLFEELRLIEREQAAQKQEGV
ncbi:MotA/TolQ/ExbB proton channel family protein [Marinobacterium stanieri]|uniref:MotA/TolQ/ExbB proton channel family protein n=1 Tax=Marinobacterium stanieri TaxID=49186 RepID=UPI000255780A|nr:MotA/TolQ/ExbB proton channel family protein [Marinobacterium stanieri]